MPSGWKPKRANAVAKDLAKVGFTEAKGRGKGSHRIFKGPGGKTVVVPDHGGKDVAAGTMRNIAKQAGLTPEELYGDQQKGAAREVDPRLGVADARGATARQPSGGQSGNRRGSRHDARSRDDRSR
jgi:predicted RNA binding protein YcfA (HicA-like mRNA interferase family)